MKNRFSDDSDGILLLAEYILFLTEFSYLSFCRTSAANGSIPAGDLYMNITDFQI